ncbi:hypothetical protein SLS56_010674 [Neofusicoccum ribis]|uniref:Dynamin family protein n=1 Tax=Neofusicoccum ribis TaxID=45134 RepID=A0ABR3SDR7_9PEZI
MPEFNRSIPGMFEDSPDNLAAEFEKVQLEEPAKEPMVAQIEDLQALGQLQNSDQSSLLEAIDELRAHGISKHIDLPQLIVCGDQSSGKSSLLEAITHLPFPAKDGICTTFATEVALRRSPSSSVKITIIPGASRSDADAARLRRFTATFTNSADFPALIDSARQCMNPEHDKSISDDRLHLDISGPAWPPLTIVDLPGLIQTETRGQTAADKRTVLALVRSYMQNSRSVVLTVVSAINDFANQGILSLAREVDPHGTRTLGIITRPDRVVVGSGDEAVAVSLAKNQEHHLALGWHVVRNRDHAMRNAGSDERDKAEREFFSQGIWASIVRPHVGVDALRTRLGGILLQQIRRELPVLIEEIRKGIADCKGGLDRLGEPRVTPKDHRAYLVSISKAFDRLTLEAVNGSYQNSFFTTPEEESHERRLRAVIQNSNDEFARVMRTYGHLREITDRQAAESGDRRKYVSSLSSLENAAPDPEVMTRSEYLEEVKNVVRTNRGRELPGTFNPLMVGNLFQKQSSPWGKIAKEHADIMWQTALGFLETLLGHLTEGNTFYALLHDHIEPAMDRIRKQLLDKVDELLKPYQSNCLITYHPQFVEYRDQIRKKPLQDGILQNLALRYGTSTVQTTLEDLARVIASTETDTADEFASVELYYCMEAFYKVALNNFIDNTATLAVENCLVSSLEDIFSPSVVALMDDDTLANLASETDDVKSERSTLQGRLKSLEEGMRILNKQARPLPGSSTGR